MPRSLNTLQRILDTVGTDARSRFLFTEQAFQTRPRRLGILDSSFNPPTRAHRHLLWAASTRFQFDHRLLCLAKTNVDKAVTGASLAHRLRMMALLARKMGDTSVGVTAHGRFVDKAEALRLAFGPQTHLYFIMGYDTAVRLFDPKYYGDMEASLRAFFALAEVVFTNRAEHGPQACQALRDSPAVRPFRARLYYLQIGEPYASMSSTRARYQLAAGDVASVELLPSEVQEYLRRHSFYGGVG